MTSGASVSDRSALTRDLILSAAERLYAEHGVNAVSNRQVSSAAGQANNFAVGYHFGDKADVVRAIVRKHGAPIEAAREAMVRELEGSNVLRDWVSCLVRPGIDYLDSLGSPTWYARFGAQVMTDPALRFIRVDEGRHATSMASVIEGLGRCLGDLPASVRRQRGVMVVALLIHTCAEHERALASGAASDGSWQDVANGLIDAVTGLLSAPVTT